jgi:hypothetical protein
VRPGARDFLQFRCKPFALVGLEGKSIPAQFSFYQSRNFSEIVLRRHGI